MWGALSDEKTGLPFKLLLVLASAVIFTSESRGTRDHILLSQIRDSPNLEGQVPVFISPRNRVAQLYPQALGSLLVASYDSQGYGGGIRTRLHAGQWIFQWDSPCFGTSYNSLPRTPQKTRVRLWVHWSVTSTGRGTDDIESTNHVIATQLVNWRADCCLATSYNIRPLRHSFHCCGLERAYGAVAWQCVDQIRWNIKLIK
jgi:hypothetical protein